MPGGTTTSYYVRDASGTVMAIHTATAMEHPVYGSSRIGIAKRTVGETTLDHLNYFYELTDHLGNVRAVMQQDGQGNAAALTRTDYYPFGMPMPDRNIEGNYPYAYQGQEKDPETGMEAFELRLWDARIGRWLTTDPYGQYSSPYLGMGNNPISNVDPDGGMDCPNPPCNGGVVDGGTLDEVVITGSSGKSGGFDFSGMPDFMRYDMDNFWTTSFEGNIDQYNAEFGTDFGSHNPGNLYNQWSYQFYYKPQYDDLISSIHAATSEAAGYVMYILPTPIAGANVAFKGVPALARGLKIGYKYTDEALQLAQLGGNLGLHRLKRYGINKSYNLYTNLPRGMRRMAYPLQKGLNREQNIFRSYLSPRLPGQIDNAYKNINNIRKFFD